MDDTNVVSYYKSKAEEWIFQPKLRNVLIDDDEILDLDSLDLSNNEDTWLYSSGNKSFMDSVTADTETDEISGGDEELAKEYLLPEPIETHVNDNADDLSPLNPDSPLSLLSYEDFRHNSFLNSIDEMSSSTMENFFHQTPKPKLNLLKKALSSNTSGCDTFTKRNIESNVTSTGSSCDSDDSIFKKPTDPNSILHSVENKLSSLTEPADGAATYLRKVQNRDIRNADGDTKDCDCEKEYWCRIARVTPTKSVITLPHKTLPRVEAEGAKLVPSSTVRASEMNENDENVCKKPLPLPVWHSTPHRDENTSRAAAKKAFSLCQPSPVLINRYLKYNKDGEEKTGKWRLSNDEFDETFNKNEMNVSFITHSNDRTNLPRVDVNTDSVDEREKQHTEDVDFIVAARKSPLNSTFSKSDNVLNCSVSEEKCISTYHLTIDDDDTSSTSESSLSSISAKHSLSIKQVQKMAELQELSLKKHIHSSYYAGSSKSSEVSSSNESVSACGVLNSSNEDPLNNQSTNTPHAKNSTKSRNLENQHPIYSKVSPLRSRINADNNYRRSIKNHEYGPKSAVTTVNETASTDAGSETKLANVFRSRLSTCLPTTTNAPQNLTGQRQQQNIKVLASSSKRVMSKIRDEAVSVKEIKSRENTEVKECPDVRLLNTNAAGPVSHIPRPLSRIPMLRTSVSCSRYSKK